eukprot:scaffold4934_cov63-Phaeocystis_antarctica.AAC.3
MLRAGDAAPQVILPARKGAACCSLELGVLGGAVWRRTRCACGGRGVLGDPGAGDSRETGPKPPRAMPRRAREK